MHAITVAGNTCFLSPQEQQSVGIFFPLLLTFQSSSFKENYDYYVYCGTVLKYLTVVFIKATVLNFKVC